MTNPSMTRLREIVAEIDGILKDLPQPDGPGAVSAFYTSLSLGEVRSLAADTIDRLEGELSCIFCAKPVAEGDAHMDDGGDVAHKDCAIQEFLAQAREERKRTAPFIKMCAEIVHPEKAVGAHYTAENRAQSAFAIIDNIKRQPPPSRVRSQNEQADEGPARVFAGVLRQPPGVR